MTNKILYLSCKYIKLNTKPSYKRYSIIDQQLAQPFVHYSAWHSKSLPFYANQIIYPFLKLRISANHDKEMGFKNFFYLIYNSKYTK